MRHFLILCIVIAIFTVSTPLIAVSDNSDRLVTFKKETTTQKEDESETEEQTKATVKVFATASNKTITVEEKEYIIGCVAAEMPASYHEEALKAQAVACYTFMKWQKSKTPDETLKGADISDSSKTHQGYLTKEQMKEKWGDSFEKYYNKLSEIATSVAGKTITYNGEPIMAVFHAICPSKTESAKVVWGSDIAYLQPVSSTGDKLSPNYSSTLVLSTEQFKKLTSSIDGVSLGESPTEYVKNAVYSDSGTVTSIEIGSKKLTGEQVRTAFSLKSAAFKVSFKDGNFTFSVNGYGHFVGMSQYGADYMARQGSTYDEILCHYYTGVKIT